MQYKFKCKCGCIKPKDEISIKHIRIDGMRTKRFFCMDHPGQEGEAIARVYYCIDCGEYVDDAEMTARSARCKKCLKKLSVLSKNMKKNRNTIVISESVQLQRLLSNPDNKYKCLNFHLCGLCIKPYFECKMFKQQDVLL